ncbi:hypothetical protein AGMMS50293_19400 [Spirochaetia bacterium]|nr:hypothetical protein AGMMS50293_19400 [Spirochaetia bacterium]
MLKRRVFTLFLLICVAVFVRAQDEPSRLIEILDGVISAAADIGRTAPSRGASNPENPSFSILNKTGFSIREILLGQAGSDNWGENILKITLGDGQSARITLNMPLSMINHYNIRLVDIDGDHYTKQDVEITEFVTIVITIEDYDF